MLVSILICVGVAAILILFVGIPYIKGVSSRPLGNTNLQGKRAYVVSNLQKFTVKNEGTSLDQSEIFLVEREKIGFKDV